MKKNYIMLVFCLMLFLLVSCAVPYDFSQEISDLEHLKIEIVNIEVAMGYHSGEPYNEENISVIKAIENNKKEAFLSDFNQIKSYQPNVGSRIESVSGEGIRITYQNGDIELITDYGTATVKSGEIQNYTTTFDSEQFTELLEKYS